MVMSEEKHIARYGTEEQRLALASRQELPPELLFFLGTDPSPNVREAVVRNPASPPHILRILARDDQASVREVIAYRMRDLLQGVAPNVTARLSQIVENTLGYLVKDAVVSVRAALAQAIADLPQASRKVILVLARDTEISVAEPVIRLSPVLEDQDLLDLIAFPAAAFTRTCIARRPGLSDKVSERISATGDSAAIQELLLNATADISEDVVADLAERSRTNASWQEALALRQDVPEKILRMLAAFIADDYANALAERADLPADVRTALRARLAHHATKTFSEDPSVAMWSPTLASVEAEAAFLIGIADRRIAEATRSLQERTGLPEKAVVTIIERQKPEELVTLAWMAGFSMRSAVAIQEKLAKLPREMCLLRKMGQEWPLSEAEMRRIRRRFLG